MRSFIFTLMVLCLIACNDSNFDHFSSAELQDRYTECTTSASLQPARAAACENIRRECERRKKEKNRTICF